MSLATRHKLPWIVAALWLWGTWYFILGAPTPQEMTYAGFRDGLSRFSELDLLGWFAMLLAAMFVADRLLCLYADRRWGVDPMTVHWSRLVNRDGFVLCPDCLSPFLVPPPGLADRDSVQCGDCGHAIAPYGEMKGYLREVGEDMLRRMARSP